MTLIAETLEAFFCERSSRTAFRGSKTTSSMLIRWNRLSRANSSTGRMRSTH